MTTYTELAIKFYIEKGGDILAVFPTEKHNLYGTSLVCYSRIGQHSTCSPTYVRELKRAKPEQYYPLLKELRGIYEGSRLGDSVTILKIK